MNKLFTKIGVAMVGLAMAIGVGVAAGSNIDVKPVFSTLTEDPVYTLTCPENSKNKSYENTSVDVEDGGITWNLNCINQNADGDWRIGQKKNAGASGVDRIIYTKTAISSNVGQIDFKYDAKVGTITVNSATVYVYNTAAKAAAGTADTEYDSCTLDYAASSTKSVVPSAGKSWTNMYYRVVWNITSASTSNARCIRLANIKFYGIIPTYTVTYNANGGTGTITDSNSPYDSGSTVTVLANTFTAPSGKMFSKWNTEANGTGIDRLPATTFTISANTELFAQWVDLPSDPYLTMDASTYNKYTGDVFNVTFTYGNIANANVGGITFSSDDTSIADVTNESSISAADGSGSISLTCKKAGTATFTVSYGGDDLDIFEVVIIDKSITITLDKTSATLWSGNTLTLTPTITAVGYSESVTWTSSNTDIATVDAGVVTPVAAGSVTITCASVDHPATTATCSVTVKVLPATYLDLDLSTDTTSSASETYLRWSTNFAAISADKVRESQTPANNYYPGTSGKTYTSTRFYSFIDLTITPTVAFPLAIIDFTATTEGYATTLANSTWTNATASASGKNVRVIVTDGTSNVECTIGNTCGFTDIRFYYEVKWAETFLSTFTCTGAVEGHENGDISVGNPTTVWGTFKTAFSKLDSATKAALKIKPANESGDAEAQALARYDLVIRKYGESTYEDYIGRFSAGGANASIKIDNPLSSELSKDSTTIIIVISSTIALVSVAGYFVIRRRKEQ